MLPFLFFFFKLQFSFLIHGTSIPTPFLEEEMNFVEIKQIIETTFYPSTTGTKVTSRTNRKSISREVNETNINIRINLECHLSGSREFRCSNLTNGYQYRPIEDIYANGYATRERGEGRYRGVLIDR